METDRELDVGPTVVLQEWRIGPQPVERKNIAAFGNMRVLQRINFFDSEAGDIVQNYFHVADGSGSPIAALTIDRQIVGDLLLFLNVLVRLNQKTTQADGRVVDLVVRFGFENLDQQANDFGRRIELAALIVCFVGKVLNQVLVASLPFPNSLRTN